MCLSRKAALSWVDPIRIDYAESTKTTNQGGGDDAW